MILSLTTISSAAVALQAVLEPSTNIEPLHQRRRDRPLRIALLSPGTTATHDIFYAFCLNGLPATHWTAGCSAYYSPLVHAQSRCNFTDLALENNQNEFPDGFLYANATHKNEFHLSETCLSAPGSPTRLLEPIHAGFNESDSCRINDYLVQQREAITLFHNATTSVTDTPFHSPSIYTSSQLLPRPSKDSDWLFVFSHRDPAAWAEARLRGSFGTMGVCDVRKPALADMATRGRSPLDQFACLEHCVERGVAKADDPVSACMVQLKELSVEIAARLYDEHRRVALQLAPGPVLNLNLFSGDRMDAPQIAAAVREFAADWGHRVPCTV